MINKSKFILNLHKMINDYNQKKYNNKLKIYKYNDIKILQLKKSFNLKINELSDEYYKGMILFLEEQSKVGKNSGVKILKKDDFKLNILNNAPSRNLELVMRKMLEKYNDKLCGLDYQIWNQNNKLYLKLVW